MDGQSANRWLVRAVGDLAERQHGVVGRAQLRDLGFPADVIDGLVRSRHLRAVHRGVYAVGHRALSHDGRRLAALLACGQPAVLTHRSGAAALGYAEDGRDVDVTVVDDVHHEHRGIRLHRSRTLQAQDVMAIRKLAVTRPARTLMDFAAAAPRAEALRAIDNALRNGCTPAALRDTVDRHRRQPGRRLIVHYLATRRASALRLRSEMERLAAEVILGSDLPAPLFNALVDLETERMEVDVWWPRHRLVLELDGRAYHEGVVAELEDARRDNVLRAAGQRVRRAAWWDVRREPGRLLATLRRSLAS